MDATVDRPAARQDPPPVKSAPLGLFQWSLLVAAAAVIVLVLVDLPEPSDGSIDSGWQMALVDGHAHHRSFGTDVVFTAGPWGWLLSHFYPPYLLGQKMLWEVTSKLAIAGTLILASLRLPRSLRWLFIGAIPLLGAVFPDTAYMLGLSLGALLWLVRPEGPDWRALLVCVAFAFLGEAKFTFMLLGICGVALGAAARWARGDRLKAAGLVVGFAAACAGCWILAGQGISAFPRWFANSWDVSSGYPQAMSLDEPRAVFAMGLICILLFIAQTAVCTARWPDKRSGLPVGLFTAAALFLIWKHGFVRADGHVIGFFVLGALLGLAWPAILERPAFRPGFVIAPLACMAGFFVADRALFQRIPENAWWRLCHNTSLVFHSRDRNAEFSELRAAHESRLSLPAVRKAVGSHSVDLLQSDQSYLFANDLTYRPRPVPQSYSAYTPHLMELNARFLHSAAAPDFLLLRYAVTDGRFPVQDDGLALAEIPLEYDVAGVDPACVILRRKPGAAATRSIAMAPLTRVAAPFGQDIPLPPGREHPIWLRAELPLSPLGFARAFFYKPPILWMTVTEDNGTASRHRAVPGILKEGCIVQPFLRTQEEYAEFVGGRGRQWLRSLRFEAAPGEDAYWGQPTVSFLALSDEALRPNEFILEAGVTDVSPLRVTSAVGVELISVEGGAALQVHAPGEMALVPPAGARVLRGGFGMRGDSFTGGAQTDGVEFSIEFVDAAGKATQAWHRFLDPLHEPNDRPPQSFEIDLPPAGLREIVLRTGIGPHNDGRWDWSYWRTLRFERPAP